MDIIKWINTEILYVGHNDSQLQGISRYTIKDKWKENSKYFEQRSKSDNYQVQKLNVF